MYLFKCIVRASDLNLLIMKKYYLCDALFQVPSFRKLENWEIFCKLFFLLTNFRKLMLKIARFLSLKQKLPWLNSCFITKFWTRRFQRDGDPGPKMSSSPWYRGLGNMPRWSKKSRRKKNNPRVKFRI